MKKNMTTKQLIETFDKYEDEYLRFDNVEDKHSLRPDLHAFILLDELLPGDGKGDLISSATHDQFWLEIELEALACVATEEIILELVRCGISIDEETESLFMFT